MTRAPDNSLTVRPPAGLGDPGEPAFSGYWRVIRHRPRILAFCAFVGALVGLGLSLPRAPVYEASASLEIQSVNESFLDIGEASPNAGSDFSQRSELQTHVRILSSRTLRDVTRAAIIEQAPVEDQARDKWRDGLRIAAAGLSVRANDDSRVIEVSSRSTDPVLAARFSNELAENYITRNQVERHAAAERTKLWLDAQLDAVKSKLEDAERELQRYAQRNSLLISQSDGGTLAQERLAQLQHQLTDARAERIRLQARADLTAEGTLPADLEATALRDYEREASNLHRRQAELEAIYTSAHYLVVQNSAQVAVAESAVARERARLLKVVQSGYLAAARQEDLLDVDFEAQTAIVSEQAGLLMGYELLDRQVQVNRDLYATFLKRLKQAGLAAALPASNIRILDRATAPPEPVSPNHPLSGAAGGVTGLFLGLIYAMARQQLDQTIKQPGEAGRWLGVRELGAILDSRLDPGDRQMTPAAFESPASSDRQVEVVAWRRRPSLLAECFRGVRTSILGEGDGSSPGIIVIASANPGEGKTTVAANLAISLAELGGNVLLVDADLRRPRLHKIFGLTNNLGLSDAASRDPERASFEAAIQDVQQVPGLSLLASGVAPYGGPGLLHSAPVDRLFSKLKESYDAIVVDTPPVLVISDARALASVADGTVLVVRAGKTDPNDALEAKNLLVGDGARLLGTVLNWWDPQRNGQDAYSRYAARRGRSMGAAA